MDDKDKAKLIEDLTLALLYLTSFTEKQAPDVRMAWKSHDWNAMDALIEDGYLDRPRCLRSHSRVLSDEGIKKAKELLEKISPALGFSIEADD